MPGAVHRVAVKPASKVIMDAPGGHALQCFENHAETPFTCRFVRAAYPAGFPKQEIENRGAGELRSGSESPPLLVVGSQEILRGTIQRPLTGSSSGNLRPHALLQGCKRTRRLRLDFFRALLPESGNLKQNRGEPCTAMPVLGRKVGTAEEGLQLRGEPDAHRPPAASREALHIGHVKPVDIGTLLAINLHVDEVRVHHSGDLRILEGLMRHHMAPVAGRITDREEDRLPLATRPGERLLTPRIPLHGIPRMLEEVGGSGGRELIHMATARSMY